jgi:serine protease inhibitor
MNRIVVFILLSVMISGNSCKKDIAESSDVPKISYTINQAKILQSSNQFGLNLFYDLAKENPTTKNIFISPLSVYLALTMAYNGAANLTAVEMQNTLGFGGMTRQEINQSCKELMDIILGIDPKVTMEIANSIWYRNILTVKPDFLSLNQNYFNAEVNSCNFEDPATLTLINNWVKSKTHNKIEKVINTIPGNAMMYLINAIYFKGTWKYQFDKIKRVAGPFYTDGSGTISANFMTQKATFNYLDNDILSAIELPYGNSGFSMVVLLPHTGKNVMSIVDKITPETWDSWCNSMEPTDVTLKLPRFKFAYDSVINESLKKIGMPKAFSVSDADFSNITNDYDLFISKVLHKSFIEVNEEGTEAAAVTIVEFENTSIGPGDEKYFIADKPFLFIIKENSSQTILFAGIMNNPAKE